MKFPKIISKHALRMFGMIIFQVMAVILSSNHAFAQTSLMPPSNKNGICAIFYVKMEEYDSAIASENKYFRRVAKRFAEARAGRCYGFKNEDLLVNEINIYKNGENFLKTLSRISREMGPISELYIFAHGVPLGIVGATEDAQGIQKQCVSSKCLSPTDFAYAAKNYLTRDANIVLHSCSVSVDISDSGFESQQFDNTSISFMSNTLKFEQINATGTVDYPINITSEENGVRYYNGFMSNGDIAITGYALIHGKKYQIQKLLHIHELITNQSISETKIHHRSIPVTREWFIDQTIPEEALGEVTLEFDLKLEPEQSFAESLMREIKRVDETSQIVVWGHDNYTKAGYNCGWVMHTSSKPTATKASASGSKGNKMPLHLQCGAHSTCKGESEIVKLKECHE